MKSRRAAAAELPHITAAWENQPRCTEIKCENVDQAGLRRTDGFESLSGRNRYRTSIGLSSELFLIAKSIRAHFTVYSKSPHD